MISGGMIEDIGMLELTIKGLTWTGFSILAVYIILMWHLESLFLSTAAIIQILLGFPISYFLFAVVFKVGYFGTLHTLIIFVILGIAADDCFVFNDAWIQSELMVEDPDDLNKRMSYTFRRATTAMAITSATTFIAFLATYFSPIMPISSFGVWAGTAVMVNYLLVITYFPAMVAFHHQNVKKYELRFASRIRELFRGKEEKKKSEKRRQSIEIAGKDDEDNDESSYQLRSSLSSIRGDGDVVGDEEQGFELELQPRESRRVELFLGDKWAKWVIKGRYIILSVFTVLVGASMWQTSKMRGQSRRIKFFEDDHFMQKMSSWQDYFVK